MKNRDIKKLFKWKIWKKGTACLLVFSVLLQTVTVSAQGIAKGPPIDMQLIQQLQEAKMPMQSDVSEEGQIVQSSGEQSELTENGQTDQPSGNQSGSLENGQTGQPSGNQSGSMENGQTVQQPGDQSGSAENGQAGQPSGDQSGSAENGQTDPSSDQQSKSADLYENGIIKIYNIEQLQAIGTGSSVRMNDTEKELFGTGEEVVDGGNAVTYASDADYMLMNEIPLTEKTMWTLPEGFTGTFAEAPKEDAPLYDKESDTVYVYNNYQLLLIASENSAEEPIMSYDMIPEKVGIGQLLYKDGTLADESAEAAQEYLTYSKEHNYVLSPSFTEQMPELKAEKIKKEATVQADAGQLGLPSIGVCARLTRSAILDEIGRQYMTVADAKGMSRRRAVIRHAFGNALIPIITYLGNHMAGIIGGASIVETIFAIPGIGSYAIAGVQSKDYYVVQAYVLFSGCIYVLTNILIDLIYIALDPKIRAGEAVES